jgi:AbrB family looped-hinge helix DNA binding protein
MSRMTSKGQVTIPKEIRDKLGLEPGDEVGFREEGGQMVIKAEDPGVASEDAADRMVRVLVEFGKTAKRIPMTDKELMDLTRGPFSNADAD